MIIIVFNHEKMETIHNLSYAYVTPSLHCLCLCVCLRLCLCRSVNQANKSTECFYLQRLLTCTPCVPQFILPLEAAPLFFSVCFEQLSSPKKGNTFKRLYTLYLSCEVTNKMLLHSRMTDKQHSVCEKNDILAFQNCVSYARLSVTLS